ncbi:MAG TPA: hypothetical protein VFZ76_13555 [Anaerolineales bacterium]
MSTWIILTIIFIWFVLPAFLIIAACIHSSRLSQAEERQHLASTVRPGGRPYMPSHSPLPSAVESLRVPVQLADGLD